MNFKSDLVDVVEDYFFEASISYEEGLDAQELAARYCEMQVRRIQPMPRRVHFSSELHDSLGKLHKTNREAWGAVFRIRHLFVSGSDVTLYLSKRVKNSTKRDGLLWDYGIHHLHLSREIDESGFVARADHLLFAVVANADVFFVDIREHEDPQDLLWIRQDLLTIIDSNWPELTESRVLRSVSGSTLTDEEKKELRRKNVNHAPELRQRAIAPLGGGTMADGRSAWCRLWGAKLIFEIEQHESYFSSQPADLRALLEAKGIDVSGRMEFRLVLLDSLSAPVELWEALQENDCLSRDLSRMGFAIVEATTEAPIVVSLMEES